MNLPIAVGNDAIESDVSLFNNMLSKMLLLPRLDALMVSIS